MCQPGVQVWMPAAFKPRPGWHPLRVDVTLGEGFACKKRIKEGKNVRKK